MRDSTIIYRSFFEAISALPKEDRATMWDAVFEYSLNFKEVELTGISKTIFILIKPLLDANIKNFENGCKPKKKRKTDDKEAKQKPKVSEEEAKDKPIGSQTEGNANKDKDKDKDKDVNKDKKLFVPPAIEMVVEYFKLNGYTEQSARKAHEYYRLADWKDSNGKQVKAWKQKMFMVWFKPENLEPIKAEPKKQLSHQEIWYGKQD